MFEIKQAVEPHPFGADSAEFFEWKIEERPVPYERALAFMEARTRSIRERNVSEMVWMLEHPPVYTAGTSADPKDLLDNRFPVFNTGRGGQYTYHGPGQRVAYVMLDLQKRGPDLRKYVYNLEQWVIDSLRVFNIKGERREGRVGIWVDLEPFGKPAGTEAKIAAIGVRVQKWVSFHGVAINLHPNLEHYNGIVPCGVSDHGVTSIAALDKGVSMAELDESLRENFERIFGTVV
ncbi:MAG: lipoyl(octanoyl) transferase LipB [Pseudomonadota bacterium]